MLLYFCTTVPSDSIARFFPGLSSVLPWSSLVFPRSFPGLSSVLPFLFLSPLPLQVFVTDAAAEAFLLVAVFLLQLDEGLAVAGVFHHQAALLPHPYYVVILGLQLLQEVEGTVAEFLFSAVPAVGEEDGDYRVDDEQIEREGGDVFLVLHTRAAKGIMGFPILCDAGRKHLLRLLHRGGLQQLAEAGTAVVIKIGKLRDADMREVLRTETEESP